MGGRPAHDELIPERRTTKFDSVELSGAHPHPSAAPSSSTAPTRPPAAGDQPSQLLLNVRPAREHKMGVSGRSAGSLLRLGVLWAHAAHGSGRNGHGDLSSS